MTPKQIQNLKKAIEDNLDYLDGYEELPEHDQERVKKALHDGHIADEDWSWVSLLSKSQAGLTHSVRIRR